MNFPSRRSPCLDLRSELVPRLRYVTRRSPRRLAQALKEAAAREQEQAAKAAGGGRSSFELFSVGVPIVMHYERTSILELTFAMYLTMAGASAIAGPASTRSATSDREAADLVAHFEARSRSRRASSNAS